MKKLIDLLWELLLDEDTGMTALEIRDIVEMVIAEYEYKQNRPPIIVPPYDQ